MPAGRTLLPPPLQFLDFLVLFLPGRAGVGAGSPEQLWPQTPFPAPGSCLGASLLPRTLPCHFPQGPVTFSAF